MINTPVKYLIGLPLVLLLLSACGGTRKVQSVISNRSDSTALSRQQLEAAQADSFRFIRDQYDSLQANRIHFDRFSGKIDVDYEESDGRKMNLTVQVRIQRDSMIWLSLTAIFGIEGVRACITQDSVRVINKQDKSYISRPISYLQEITALPLDLRTLQDLLVGNPVFLDSTFQSYSRGAGSISLQGTSDLFRKLLTMGETDKLISSYKLDDLSVIRPRTSYLTYSDYENKLGPWFARRRMVQVSERKNISVRLHYKQYAFNETLSFPFSVPKNYKIE